ncbi:hypothetical protein [Limnohabitans sp. Hippo3]|uniref:hypothetical protein n=1 Tax=Limnohabitans sp. Hippo3 TaxID=1597956 RepID=UPI000D359DAE|nr:hypothetical protein [Limnohabitans sp. Hippo3]PUE41036.1 hypothetical protein B9Z34_06800 [Limnohabitans sp. Hippo3]
MSSVLKKYKKISYQKLSASMKESYNFQKASAVLADYGFVTNLLPYDWMGADFLAQHLDGDWLKIQLKGRITIDPKYENKEIFIMFEDKKTNCWYLYPHDKLVDYCRKNHPTKAFSAKGFSRGVGTAWIVKWLEAYKIISV